MAKSRKQDDLLGMSEPESDSGFLDLPPTEEASPGSASAAEPRRSSPPVDDGDLLGSTPVSNAPRAQEGYVVLARRYRPQTFDEIVGQEHVQGALRGAIATGQIGHAYLFTGPRGTGKTSSARILAKALNCMENGPRPDPCGRCASCRAIAAGSSLDVIEIDAASNTGVDSIRELRSGVALSPFSRFKVYIVDEVHMLSMQAFNALLKTLEEPPAQVIFVLATTELQKVPETIISRCQVFNFRRFSTAEIVAQLDRILSLELERRNLTVSDEDRGRILELVARNAEGGMRDAQVALDQVLVLSRDRLDFDSVRRFLGTVEAEVLDRFVRALDQRHTDELLLLIEELTSTGQDLELFVKNLADYVRDLLILRTAPDKPELVNVAPDRFKRMQALAGEVSASFLLNLASSALRLSEEMKGSSQARFLLEFAVIRITQVDPVDDISKIVARLQELEKALAAGRGGGEPGPGGQGPVPAPPPASSGAGGGGPGAVARSQAPERTPAAVPPPVQAPLPERKAPPVRRQADVSLPAAPAPLPLSLPEVPVPVADSAPAPAPFPAGQRPASLTPEDFQKALLAKVAERHLYGLHTTLLETGLVSFNDTTFVIGARSGDSYTLAHLDTTHNQTLLKELAQEITGRELLLRVQPIPELVNPFLAVAAPGSTAPPPPEPPRRPPPADAPPAAAAAVAANPPENFSVPDDDSPRPVVFSPELRNSLRETVKGGALRQLLESHEDLKELTDKIKSAFQIDDAQITFTRSVL